MFFIVESLLSLLLAFFLSFNFSFSNDFSDFSFFQRYALVSDLVVLWAEENAGVEKMLEDSEKFLKDFCLIVDSKIVKCVNPDGKVFVYALFGDGFSVKGVYLGG